MPSQKNRRPARAAFFQDPEVIAEKAVDTDQPASETIPNSSSEQLDESFELLILSSQVDIIEKGGVKEI